MNVLKFGLSFVLVCILISNVESRPKSKSKLTDFQWQDITKTCGYESCPVPKEGMINVHIVTHTHDDVGWLKTMDQYYFGSKDRIQKAGVQYILDSVVRELSADARRRFTYVESSFFFKWWDRQPEHIQDQVKQLVQEGRLEFAGGAWVMNDEAVVHYQSIIDQFTIGLKKLNDTFGECARPRVAWQIDPFGHSREFASLLAQMNYDGLFFARVDYADKNKRLLNRNGEFVWQADHNLGEKADLFSSLLYNHYSSPPGFCFDYLCSDDPIIDDKRSPDNNVKQKVDDFAFFVNNMQDKYRTNNLLVTMGDDFHYQSAGMWYKNLDKLITYTNERQNEGWNINLFYSTPSCYLKSLHESNTTWPIKTDDFFPFSTDPHAFWTGYYTSRPNKKRFERYANNFLQTCKQLSALHPVEYYNFKYNLEPLQEAMGVLQHHDAIPGTEKQAVNDDYCRMLHEGILFCEPNTEIVLNELTNDKDGNDVSSFEESTFQHSHVFEFDSCHNLNISQCDLSEKTEQFIVTVYNPKAHVSVEHIRIPVVDGTYSVRDDHGDEVTHQLIPIPDPVQQIHYRESNAINELVFSALSLPPLGYRSYYISKISAIPVHIPSERTKSNEEFTIGNAFLYATFNEHGILSRVSANGAAENLTQEFFYYEGAVGNNEIFENRSSGAYIFRPNSLETIITENVEVQLYRGPVVDEVHQVFNEWISQVVRIYKDENYIEFEWLVGPIPIEDNVGKEVISRFSTIIESNEVFETDDNGRQMLNRRRNHRETWDIDLREPIAGNYYPVTTKIAIQDSHARMAVLNDRAQGGSSLYDGTLELMVHRRLLHDDAFGVGEALNETAYGKGIIARGQHYLVFGSSHLESPSLKAQERFIQLNKQLKSWLFFSNATDLDLETWQKDYVNSFSGLGQPLPPNIHLLTFEPWQKDSLLIRLEHILEKDEDNHYSMAESVDLKGVLGSLKLADIRETSLGANQWLDDTNRFKFRKEGTMEPVNGNVKYSDKLDDYTIVLEPMQIRTFIVTLEQ